MTDPSETDVLPRKNLRVMQITTGVMFMGAIAYMIFAIIMVQFHIGGFGGGRGGNMFVLTPIACIGLIVMSAVSFIVPGHQTRNALATIVSGKWQPPRGALPASFTTDASKLLTLRQMTLLQALAPLEGAAFLGCIAYLIEGQLVALVAVALASLFPLVNFPTEYRVRTWLETQRDQLALMRQQS